MKKKEEKILEKYKKIFVEEFEGPNLDEAIKMAISSLRMTKDELKIKVLFEGEPGLFGLAGSKPAKIKVMPKTDKLENLIKYFVIKLLDFIKEKISFTEVKIEDKRVEIKVLVEDDDVLKNLFAKNLQQSVSLLLESFVKKINPEFEINLKFQKLNR
ncbi:MAG: Jag N-terminal domain-containing protein [Endomicrobiia bacterium]